MRAGEWDEAFRIGEAALSEGARPQDRLVRMELAGNLAQLCKRLGKIEEGLRYVETGIQIALATNDAFEINLFLIDQAHLEMARGRFADALRIATEARRVASRALNDTGELKAHGTICRALVALGEYGTAEREIRMGLEQAVRMGHEEERAAFLFDLGESLAHQGKHREALSSLREGAVRFSEIGRADFVAGALGVMLQICATQRTWQNMRITLEAMTLMGHTVHHRFQGSLLRTAVDVLQSLAETAPPDETEAALRPFLPLWEVMAGRSEFSHVLFAVGQTLLMWIADAPECVSAAIALRTASRGVLDLVEVVSQPAPRRSRRRKLLGVLRAFRRRRTSAG